MHAIQFAAFYMVNYNCFYDFLPKENSQQDDLMGNEITCIFQKTWFQDDRTTVKLVEDDEILQADQTEYKTLTEIFEKDCFKLVHAFYV